MLRRSPAFGNAGRARATVGQADREGNGGRVSQIATDIADWARSLSWTDVPPEVRSRLAVRFADAIGVAAAAWDSAPGRAVRALAEDFGGHGDPLLFGSRPLHPAWAALAHGTLIHALDYDDTFPRSVVHPMGVLLPSALAGVQDTDRPAEGPSGGGTDGSRVMAAIAAGDEVLARLGAQAGRDLHARGFQATGIFGPLAAALVTGVLRRRDPRTIAGAMGLAGSMSGGLLAFLADGTWSKRLHPGWAAHGGVTADGLAARSFPGPAGVVEGRHGIFDAFLGRPVEADDVLAGLGRRWLSVEAEIKLYPCAHVIHPFIGMARILRAEHGWAADDIREVVCGVAPWYVPIVCEPLAEKLSPTTEAQARTSLQLSVALALLDGTVGVRSFEPASTERPQLRELAARVRYEPDPALAEGFGARLVIRTHDREFVGRPEGDAAGEAGVHEKFLATTGADPAAAEALWTVASTLDTGPLSRLREAAVRVAESWVRPR